MAYKKTMAFVVSAAIWLQVTLLGPMQALAGSPDSPLTPVIILGNLAVAFVVSAVVFWALLVVLDRFVTVRAIPTFAAFGIWLYIAFYGLAPDFGPFDGRALRFEAFESLGWLEVGIAVVLLLPALLAPRWAMKPMTVLVAFFAVANAAQVAIKTPWGKPGRLSDANAEDLVSSNDFTTSAGRTEGVPVLSSSKNVFIIVLDTFQNDVFEGVLKSDPKLSEEMTGFTMFTNAVGHFPFTKLSIATVLRGEPFDGKGTIPEYLARTDNLRLPAVLDKAGYAVDLLPLHSRDQFLANGRSACRKYAELADLYAFRQAPIMLKRMVYQDGQFLFARDCPGDVPVTEQEQDLAVLDRLDHSVVVGREQASFKWIHLWGMHPPARLDANCESIKSRFDAAAIHDQGRCILGRLAQVLDKIKAAGVYDKSQIVIISDHGSLLGLNAPLTEATAVPMAVMSSAHPTIALKDFGQSGPLQFNTAPVVLADIYQTILADANVQHSGRTLREIGADEKRDRQYTFFKSAEEASSDTLSLSERFMISGNVRDPKSWATGSEGVVTDTLSVVDFGTPEALKFANPAFSTEAKGIGGSWVLSNPASVRGSLPNAGKVKISARFLSPHADQDVKVEINGREVGDWKSAPANQWATYEAVAEMPASEEGKPGAVSLKIGKFAPLNDPARPLGIFIDWIKVEPLS